jgi:hypothetical protein
MYSIGQAICRSRMDSTMFEKKLQYVLIDLLIRNEKESKHTYLIYQLQIVWYIYC